MKTYETNLCKIKITDILEGKILDIGGGGEGVVGRAFGKNVTAIDKRQDELEEAPCDCEKIVMDASDLKFPDNSFDAVTSFFTMMYIPKSSHKKVLQEAYRVLKSGGKMVLWDAQITENKNSYDVFIIQLKILLQNETIRTGYGVGYDEQNADYYRNILKEVGFQILDIQICDTDFKITAQKI